MHQLLGRHLLVGLEGLVDPGVIRQVVYVVVGLIDGSGFVPKYAGADVFDVEAVVVFEPVDRSLQGHAGIGQVVHQQHMAAQVGSGHGQISLRKNLRF